MPADLMLAISHAQTILGWQKNLTSEDMPPQWMWPLADELEEWFDEVERRMEERYGTDESREDAPDMEQNELTAHMRRR